MGIVDFITLDVQYTKYQIGINKSIKYERWNDSTVNVDTGAHITAQNKINWKVGT